MENTTNPTLTNVYEERKKSFETFWKECATIEVFLKASFAGQNGIDVLCPDVDYRPENKNMLYAWMVVFDTINKGCMLLQLQCDANIFFWIYRLPQEYKTADQIFRSRFFDDGGSTSSCLQGKRTINLQDILSSPLRLIEDVRQSKPANTKSAA